MRTRWLFDLIANVWRDLYRSLWALLLYDAVFALLSFLLLTPLLSWAASFTASSSGRFSITNGEVLAFLLAPRGILFVLLVGSLTVVTLYVKHAGMMLIAWEGIAGRSMSTARAFQAVVRRLPGLTVLGSYHVAAHVILLLPVAVLGALIYRFALHSMRVYFLFLENAAVRWAGLAAAVLLLAATIVVHGAVYLHWVFSLPALLVEDLSPASALAYTHELLKGTRRRIGAVVLLLWTATILLPFALGQGFHLLGGSVFARLPAEHRLVMPVVLMLMAGYLATSFLGEFITVAVSSLTITRLYGDLRRVRDADAQEPAAIPAAATRQDSAQGRTGPTRTHGAVARLASYLSGRPHPGLVVAIVILVAVVTVATAAAILSNFELRDNVRITAHRGSSFGAPENTMAALRRAVEDGADYAELDVRLTADGYAVLLHDRDLFRVAGVKRNLSELKYEQIRTLDVGSWFAPGFRNERIPLLSEAVAFSVGKIRLNIELKVEGAPRRLAERVVAILHEHDAVSNCVVSSSNIEALEHVRDLAPSIRRGYILSQSIGEVAALDVDFLSVSSRLVTPGLIDAARAAGKQVHVWTVNTPRQMTRFIDLGVHNIITDVPVLARALLEERAAMSNQELLFVKVRSWFLR